MVLLGYVFESLFGPVVQVEFLHVGTIDQPIAFGSNKQPRTDYFSFLLNKIYGEDFVSDSLFHLFLN